MSNTPDAVVAALADAVVTLAHRIEPRALAVPDAPRLTRTEIVVLHEVARQRGITATGIARLTGLQRSNVSAIVHRLESLGLLAPTAPEAGVRGVGIGLTDRAEGELEAIRAYRAERLRAAPADVLAAVAVAAEALERLAAHLPAPEAPASARLRAGRER